MVTMGVMHDTVPAYVKQDTKNFDMVVSNTEPEQFASEVESKSPQVLVLDLGLLGPHPLDWVNSLEKKAMPETTIIIYSFAKRSVIEELRSRNRQVMRGPLKMQDLRTALVNLIVRDMTARPKAPTQPIVPDTAPPAGLFTAEQMARLQEIQSAVDCECPNHVSDTIISLQGFENYSKQCENKDDADARMHEFLYRAAGHSRALMEHAMQELCKFEGIDLEHPTAPSPA